MTSIINDGKVTNKIKDVYKFIDKHEKDIITIFDTVYNDISSIFSDVTNDDECITVIINEPDSINSVFNMTNDIIMKHTKDILGDDNTHIVPYVFKTAIINNAVTVMFKK